MFDHSCHRSGGMWLRIRIQDFRRIRIRIRIRIQSGFRVWWLKTEGEKIQQKLFFIFFYLKMQFLLMSKLQEKPSALKREHPALQKMKFINFFMFWGHFCPTGSRSGHGSRDPIESGRIHRTACHSFVMFYGYPFSPFFVLSICSQLRRQWESVDL